MVQAFMLKFYSRKDFSTDEGLILVFSADRIDSTSPS
jgi:hypothetical protein